MNKSNLFVALVLFMKEIVGKLFLDDKLKDKSSGLIGERIDVRLSQARPYGLFV